jgi:hypothetical protein
MTTKQPTQRRISALLARNGFQKSVSTPSRIKGLRNHSSGYVVTGPYEGIVWVQHQTYSDRPLPEDLKRIAEKLAAYAADIEDAGFAVSRQRDRLVVSAPAEAKGGQIDG